MAANTEATISNETNEFSKYLMTLKAPATFEEIEHDCRSLNIGDKLKEMLEHAETNGVIISKTASIGRVAGELTNQIKVFYKNCNPKPVTQLTITDSQTPVRVAMRNQASYSFPQSRRRVNLPFRSPAVINKTSTTPTTTPIKRLTTKADSKSIVTSSEPSYEIASKSNTLENSFASNATTDAVLQETILKLDEDIALLSKDHNESELDLHVKALHEYNEIKDVGQVLLGKLAESLGMTTSDMYERFSLDLED